jgi:CHAD domain-containing protein
MPIDGKRARLAFRRLARELAKLEKKFAPDNVHKFRTNGRRVEAALTELLDQANRNEDKLLKLLAKLRRKAGRVRDLDVQISCLRNLKIQQSNGHKTQLLEELVQDRSRREKKLAKAFDHETAAELRKRLKRAANKINGKSVEPFAVALERLEQLGRGQNPLNERILHQYRIIGKRARYLAELAIDDAATSRLIAELKKMQDVIGDWHDWLKLTQRAEKLLGSSRDSALVAMLRNVTQAKFHQSSDAVKEIRALLANNAYRNGSSSALSRKPSTKETTSLSAAAVA